MNAPSTWTKLPAIHTGESGLRSGCLTCGPSPTTLEMSDVILSAGLAGVTADGTTIWSQSPRSDAGIDDAGHLRLIDTWTVQDAEDAALRDPDRDWRVFYWGPLVSETYQRHAPGQWVLVEFTSSGE